MQKNESESAKIAKRYHKQQAKKKRPRRVGRVKTPVQYQMEVSECGAASLSMILQYYGKYVPLEELRVETGVSRNGCNAKNIYLAGEHYGMNVVASRRDVNRLLAKNHPPCMLHWNYSHFVVFEGVRFGKFYINDPMRGRRKLTRKEFEESYSGVVLEFTPGENFVRDGKKKSLAHFVFERVKGQKTAIAALILLGIALIVPGILSPVFGQVFTDYILVKGNKTWLKWLILMMLCSMLFDAYFTYISTKISLHLRTKLTLITTDSMLSHMFRLPMEFFEQRFAGDLVGRVYNNIAVSSFLSGQMVSITINVLTSALYLAIMLAYSVKLSIIGVVFSVISVLIASLTSRKMVDMTYKFAMDRGRLNGHLYNGLSASASIKAVGAEGEYVGRLLGYYSEVALNDQKLGRIQTILDTIPGAISSANTVLLLIFGSREIMLGNLTPGGMMAFAGFLGSFSSPFSSIVSFVRNMQQVKNDMARVEDVMRYKEDENYTSKKDESLNGKKLSGDILLEKISFAYGKLDTPFIRNFNMHVKCGQSVALVGTSGCGKSTISKMLSGLYRPWSGKIQFDNKDIDTIPSEVINSSVAVVTQNIALFDGSIYDNITTWNKGIREEDVIRAAKDACINDEILLKKDGYDTLLSENGSNISGGQRQRLEIAKALAINPTILILDEATSSLDAVTEKKIIDNIKRRGCTSVIVAQRLSTIRDCDEIIVMENGKITERGNHETLLALDGVYKKLISEAE